MADFLSRLIQRASGRMPGIRPLVRSGYGISPPVNESVTEFEETVTFNDEIAPEDSAQKPQILPEESPRVDSTSDIPEIRELIETDEEQEIQMSPGIPTESPVPESQSTRRKAQGNEKLISTSKYDAQVRNDSASSPEEPRTESQEKAGTGERVMRVVNRQRLVHGEKPLEATTPPGNRAGPDSNLSLPATGRMEAGRTNTVDTGEEIRQLISPDITWPEKDFLQELEPINPDEQGFNVNSAIKSRINAPPSVNVRVSIGRVEIKAVEEPEPEIQQLPSMPVGSTISLDAYLKSRDEERR